MTDEPDYEPEDPCMPWQPALPKRSLAAALAERLAELIGAALTENPVVAPSYEALAELWRAAGAGWTDEHTARAAARRARLRAA